MNKPLIPPRDIVIVFSIICFVLSGSASMATHLRAGEIRTKRISNTSLSYEINVIAYRDTGSDIQFGGGVLFVDGQELTGFDNTEIDLGNGISINEFKIEYTFSQPGTYTIGYQEENRNEGVINFSNSVDTPFYLEALLTIDNLIGLNSSPQLLAPPVVEGITGMRLIHNPQAFDPDGDSISFSLTAPRQAAEMAIPTYSDPNSAKYYLDFERGNQDQDGPPQYFVVNENSNTEFQNGDLVWDAPGSGGVYNIAIMIGEWRLVANEWRMIGYTIRDMQVLIEGDPVLVSVEHDLRIEARIFPNPASEVVRIITSYFTGEYENIELIDINGKRLGLSYERIGLNQIEIDLGSIPSGTYFLKISNSGVMRAEKFRLIR